MKNILRKFIIFSLILAFSFSLLSHDSIEVSADTSWPSGPGIYGESAVLIDAATGTVLYSKKSDQKMYPASITKIMTALLTIENCDLDETVVFSEYAINSLEYDAMHAECQIGEEMTVKECLYALMLTSANEVATALGEHIAGSEKEFAKMMTERAKEAGAKNTNFVNANGLHNPDHYVTAYDMAMITRAAAQYDIFNEIVNTTAFTISKNNKRKETFTSYQRHKMVWPTSGFYYEGIIGGKTGFTDQSGTTLVTYAKRNGMTLICVVLNSNGYNVYKDTTALLDFGFANFNLINPSTKESAFTAGDSLGLTSPFLDNHKSIGLDTNSAVVIPKDVNFTDLTTSVDFNLSENSFGTVTYSYGDKTVGHANLVYVDTAKTESPTKQEANTTIAPTTETTNEDTPASQTVSDPPEDSSFGTIMIIVVIILVLIIIFILYKRRLERIRARKRHRRR